MFVGVGFVFAGKPIFSAENGAVAVRELFWEDEFEFFGEFGEFDTPEVGDHPASFFDDSCHLFEAGVNFSEKTAFDFGFGGLGAELLFESRDFGEFLLLDFLEDFVSETEDLLVDLEEEDLAAELLAVEDLIELALFRSLWVQDAVLVGDGATLLEEVVDFAIEPR